MDKYYNIAGLNVKMRTFGRTEAQAVPYEIPETQDVDLEISTDAYDFVEIFPNLTEDVREYIATGSLFYRGLLRHNGIMLHSSAVVVDNKAYLFSADPGTGKSTHTGLWLKQFGDRAYILNDDKPALRLEDGVWYAYGTPWSGKHDISFNARVPLAGIAVLERGKENIIEPYNGRDVIQKIMMQVNKPSPAEYRVLLIKIVDKLIRQVPVWRLQCNMDPTAAIVSYGAMSGLQETLKGE